MPSKPETVQPGSQPIIRRFREVSFHGSEFRLKLTLLPHSEYQTEALQGDRYSLSDSVYARTGLILLYSEICSDSRSYSQYTVTLYHKHQYLFVVFES